MTDRPKPPTSLKIIATIALAFGAMTLFSGGSVLFGPDSARQSAGAYMPFVLWFNFVAGFAYIAAAVGILLGRGWAFGLSLTIAVLTGVVGLIFAGYAMSGAPFEMRTVGALTLRTGFWSLMTYMLSRTKP